MVLYMCLVIHFGGNDFLGNGGNSCLFLRMRTVSFIKEQDTC